MSIEFQTGHMYHQEVQTYNLKKNNREIVKVFAKGVLDSISFCYISLTTSVQSVILVAHSTLRLCESPSNWLVILGIVQVYKLPTFVFLRFYLNLSELNDISNFIIRQEAVW